MQFYTRRDNQERLACGSLFGLPGGEANLHNIEGDPSTLAKVFNNQPMERDASHWRALSELLPTPTNRNMEFVKPGPAIEDELRQVKGFLLPKIRNALPVENLMHNQEVGERFRLHICNLLWQGVMELHEAELFRRDFPNELIDQEGKLYFIDTDSLSSSSKTFGGFKEKYAAPEVLDHAAMSEGTVSELRASSEEDAFSLGLYTYEILQGIHPFKGIFHGQGKKPELSERIRRGLFPHGRVKAEWSPSSEGKQFSQLPMPLQELFFSLFVDGHSVPKNRPSVREIASVFEDLAPANGVKLSDTKWEALAGGTSQELNPNEVRQRQNIEPVQDTQNEPIKWCVRRGCLAASVLGALWWSGLLNSDSSELRRQVRDRRPQSRGDAEVINTFANYALSRESKEQ